MTRAAAIAADFVEDDRARAARFDAAPGRFVNYVITPRADWRIIPDEPGAESRAVSSRADSPACREEAIGHPVIKGGYPAASAAEIELQ